MHRPPFRKLSISADRRRFEREDGTPFFYLADTAWELFHRLSFKEAQLYLDDRAAKGFTVIQAVVLAELDGLHTPNSNGHRPLIDDDPTQPNEAYFRDVDRVVDAAAARGLAVGMLPTWGDKWNRKWGVGPEIFTPTNAAAYGRFLGERYRDRPIIWIVGGDRPIDTDEQLAITRAMATGLRDGDGGQHLITFHPAGGRSSSQAVHDEPWLDFNMVQTGHDRDAATWRFIDEDYARQPIKPVVNGEPCYEHIARGLKTPTPYLLDDHDTRMAAYCSLFAGACGHTYGCNEVWQMWAPGRAPVINACLPWDEALHLPGSAQMRHVRWLCEARPMHSRIPAPELLVGERPPYVRATRDVEGTWAMVYTPYADAFELDLRQLGEATWQAWWYDPRYGTAVEAGPCDAGAQTTFTPPGAGRRTDWVLVVDDVARGYPLPGHDRPAEG